MPLLNNELLLVYFVVLIPLYFNVFIAIISLSYLYKGEEEEVFGDDPSARGSQKIRFDVQLQTPVIMLPRTPNNPEVLVAHLGRISMENSVPEQGWGGGLISPVNSTPAHKPDELQTTEKIHMEIRDMNLYSVNLDNLVNDPMKGTRQTLSKSSVAADLSDVSKTSYGTPILHDTVLQLTIQKSESSPTYINTEEATLNFEMDGEEFSFRGKSSQPSVNQSGAGVIKVKGKVVTPLKLVLSKHVYEQILQTLDNITPPDDEESNLDSSTLSSPIDKMGHSSMSPLR